jgi:acyl carrier protein
LDEVIQGAFVSAFNLPPEQFSDALEPQDVTVWDSLGHLKLVAALQEKLGIEFEIDEIMQMESAGKIKEILGKRGIQP